MQLMIKRERDPNFRPASLDPTGAEYLSEIQSNQTKIVALSGQPWRKVSKNLVFKLYAKDQDVKTALSNLFGNKCAYCECTLGNQDLHTEHFRPKALVDAADNPTEEGYWWLAADWKNLLPACTHCNRSPGMDHQTLTPGESGKKNRFPLFDEAARAKTPGLEGNERPKLLDPTVDEPATYLFFNDVGGRSLVDKVATNPSSEQWHRAEATISIIGLNRPGLVRSRNEYIKPLKILLRFCIAAAGRYNAAVRAHSPMALQVRERNEMVALWDEIYDTYLSEQSKQYIHAAVRCIDAEFRAAGLSLRALSGGRSLYLPDSCLS
jgi:uncharacterized protein (TIGR02646 family)